MLAKYVSSLTANKKSCAFGLNTFFTIDENEVKYANIQLFSMSAAKRFHLLWSVTRYSSNMSHWDE